MNDLPTFEFVDGKLIPSDHQYVTIRKRVPRRKWLSVPDRLPSRERRRRARERSGKNRRNAKRISPYDVYPKAIPFDFEEWERHTIAVNEEVPDPYRFWRTTVQLRPVCFVYLPKGIEPDEAVLNVVMRWHVDPDRLHCQALER